MKYYAIPRPVLLFALGLCTVLFSASAALDHYSIGLIPTASAQEAAATEKKSSPTTSPAGTIGRIQLPNDDYAAGVLLASPSADRIRWQATQFIDPFEFTAAAVRSIQYPLPETLPNPQGEYCFELLGNDTLFGDLVSLDAQSIVLNSEALGRISIERSQVRRFYRWRGGAELLFLGPDGLAGWNQLENPKAWADEGGQPATKKPNAAIWRNFTLPDKCIIDFEVAWNAKADFTLAVGVPADKNLGRDAFRFEVWDNQLVAHREVSNAADLIPLMPVENGPGRAHFVTYLDQQAGRMLVCAPDGTMLGDLKVAASKPQTHPGLQLTNHRGDIRLERLRISRWDGTPPQTTDIARARILRTDGAIAYGRIDGYDAATREFVIDEDGQQKRIASEQIADVVPNASKPADTTTEPTTTPATAAASDPADAASPADSVHRFAATMLDGTRVQGELEKLDQASVTLRRRGIREPLALPTHQLRSLVSLSRSEPPAPAAAGRTSGVLSLAETRLSGSLVDSSPQANASDLVWQPVWSSTSSAMRRGVDGRIVYREPPPPVTAQQPQQVRRPQRGLVEGIVGALFSGAKNVPQHVEPKVSQKYLHLISGDTIPCEVLAMNEQGVKIRTPLSAAEFVPHSQIKAADFVGNGTGLKLGKTKRERLLTLPRMQKNSPPTHIISSHNGDFLRGRILEMDEKSLKVEVRSETREIARDVIAQIIWLQPETSDASTKEPGPAPEESGTRVQTLSNDGLRLTFFADRLQGDTLGGRSPVLGVCHAELTKVDQLLIGKTIDEAAAQLAYNKWKLQQAVEPRFVKEEAENAATPPSGTDSPLVGKPAPDFKVPLLSGETFKLTEQRGKIVVLDFWATWCGPCMQSMPEVDRVVREFEDRGVQLIAVNLEEPASQIKTTLERLKLKVTVARDEDGVVAHRYAATAIPQTVIIDRQGKITRLFVGGGPKLSQQLHDAIKELVDSGTGEP